VAVDPGNVVQNAIYLSGGTPWPIGFDAWEARARELLEQTHYDYVAGGAGAEETMRANLDAFRRRALRPRMLVGTAERDISVEVLGLHSAAPFLLAPVGVLSIVHADAERAVAGAARSTGVPMVLSSAASTSLEGRGGARPAALVPAVLVGRSRARGEPRPRAEAAGYGAIVLTVDTLTLGWRPRDLRHGYMPFLKGRALRSSSPSRLPSPGSSHRPTRTSSRPR
jgi:isopentenyl diphosphate isomerase/L-lactate dehydrogenase-like FMN-dependent dehydrogenase